MLLYLKFLLINKELFFCYGEDLPKQKQNILILQNMLFLQVDTHRHLAQIEATGLAINTLV